MGKLFWFGWLLKGRCEIAVIDGVLFFLELVVFVFVLGVLLSVAETVHRMWLRAESKAAKSYAPVHHQIPEMTEVIDEIHRDMMRNEKRRDLSNS